jgi:hypothetical protein
LILAAAFACSSCGDTKDWTLFVYPAGSGGFAIITPGFDREMCRLAGTEAVRSHSFAPGRQAMIASGESGQPTFECGRQCRVHEGQTISVCKETFDEDD